ncbi:MAG: hypothetical protein AB1777_01765 [Bacteroidota bacterium]
MAQRKLKPIAVLDIQKHVLCSKLEVYVFLKYQHCRITGNAKIKNSANRKRFQNKKGGIAPINNLLG